MNHNIKTPITKIHPYLLIGIAIVISIVALIIFSWLLICGIIFGAVIYLIATIKSKFFAKKIEPVVIAKEKERIGNVYDHDEFNK